MIEIPDRYTKTNKIHLIRQWKKYDSLRSVKRRIWGMSALDNPVKFKTGLCEGHEIQVIARGFYKVNGERKSCGLRIDIDSDGTEHFMGWHKII